MSVSVIKRKRLIRLGLYLGAVLFCILFWQVYRLFSHGVTSFFMTNLFLLPAVGFLMEGVLLFGAPKRFRRSADNLFHCGIGTGTVGFLLQGIFEIAGTDSPYMIAFPVVGGICLLGAVVCFCLPAAEGEGDGA